MSNSRELEVKTTSHFKYYAPDFDCLLNSANNNLKKNYQGVNPKRNHLVELLDSFHIYINKQISHNLLSTIDAKDICMGLWVYALESINNEYRLSNASFQSGYLYNSGSRLHKLMRDELEINQHNELRGVNKLFYLSQLYNFLYVKNNYSKIPAVLDVESFKAQLISMMSNLVYNHRALKVKILRTIPSEKAIDRGLLNLLKAYHDSKDHDKIHHNFDRIYLAKLSVAVCTMNPGGNESRDFKCLSRELRIKLGMLIYIIESIKDTYWLRSHISNSKMVSISKEIFGESYDFIDVYTKLACVSALDSYLRDESNRKIIEKTINDAVLPSNRRYLDPYLIDVHNNLASMIKKYIRADRLLNPSKVTISAAVLGALIASAPGYGAGYSVGYGISIGERMGMTKSRVSKLTGKALALVFSGGSYFGYYAADIVVSVTLERFFAKTLETLAMLLGAAGVGAVTFIIYDISFKTVVNLLKVCADINKRLPSSMITDDELEFIKVIDGLPDEVFPKEERAKLAQIRDDFTDDGLGQIATSPTLFTGVSEIKPDTPTKSPGGLVSISLG